jgi:superfamily II DNA/RNA helicase
LPLSSLGTLAAFARELKITALNQIQTQIFPVIINSIQNVFVGASSGSGKFTLALMAAHRVI